MSVEAIITGDLAIQSPLPSGLLGAIRRDMTFANPEYLRMRQSGRDPRHVPRHIVAWTEEAERIRLPRGYGRRLHDLATTMGAPIRWDDRRIVRQAAYPDRLAGVTLRPYQRRAVEAACAVTQGVVVSPTGSGKTMTALEIIRRQGQSALVMVHNRELLRQWRAVIRQRLGVEAGIVGDGQWIVGQTVTVAMIQTLIARPEAATRLAQGIGLILADECHHLPAVSFGAVIGMFPAKWRYGFTATPDRRDGLGGMIHRLLGDVVATVSASEVLSIGGIVPVRIEALSTGCDFSRVDPARHGWGDFLGALAADDDRNRLIARIVRRVAGQRPTLILTDRVAHAEALAGQIPEGLLIHGGMTATRRKAAMAGIADAAVTIGTKGLLGEGLDISAWSALVLASPISGETPLKQAVGRVIRPAPGKVDGLVVDLVDDHPFAYGSFRKRRAVYNKNRWTVGRHKDEQQGQ